MSSATRELLADRYRLTERIATGGMGVVWRARDERLGRDVAIKLIRPEYADDPTFRQRLRQEARATAAIRDPHVVRLHDVCEERDPRGGCSSFIVMELVDGQPLSAVLRDGPCSSAVTIGIARQVASALAAAHDQRIVHRDIKPANLMLDSNGRVTVLDFGIARAADAVALTATDLILGTARYISPEQADGRGATAASDVYSLGVVAYQCLTGSVPFEGRSDIAVALAHLREPVPTLPSYVPSDLAHLVGRMLAKAPGDRPTAHEVQDALGTTSTAGDTEPIARPQPTADASTTRVLRTLPLPRLDRLAVPNLRDGRSLPMRPAMLLATAAATVVLLTTAAIAGDAQGAPHSAAGATNAGQTRTRTISVDPFSYLGEDWPTVRAQLSALDLIPVAQFVGDGPIETVVGLAPTGHVTRGSRITVEVSGQAAPKPGPPTPGAGHGGPEHGPDHLPPGQAKKQDGPGPD